MFLFAFPIFRAMTAHSEAQFAFWNDLSRMLSESIQKICEANLRMREDMCGNAWKLQPAGDGTIGGAEGTRLAPDKTVAYRQHSAHLGADLQADRARVRTRRAPETTRTAQARADEVTYTIRDYAEQVEDLSKASDVAAERAREQEVTDQAGRDMHAEGHIDAPAFPLGASGKTSGHPGKDA